jgi:DNA-binding MarR family transcriptional regulator
MQNKNGAPVTGKQEFRLDDSLGFALARVARGLKFRLRKAFLDAGHDVTPEQWAVLCRLWEQDGRSQKDLAESLFKDTANITRMLDVLEKRGLLFRAQDTNDRRIYKIHLTDGGRGLKKELVPIVTGLLQECFSCLGKDEKNAFMDTLNRIHEHLKTLEVANES